VDRRTGCDRAEPTGLTGSDRAAGPAEWDRPGRRADRVGSARPPGWPSGIGPAAGLTEWDRPDREAITQHDGW